MSIEIPEQRAERIFKEDEEKQEKKEQQELRLRRLKRIAVVEKHKDVLDSMIVGKPKSIRWRKHFHAHVFRVAYMDFVSECQEYQHVGKPGRMVWTDHLEMFKAFKIGDPIHGIIVDIIREFGCFEY